MTASRRASRSRDSEAAGSLVADETLRASAQAEACRWLARTVRSAAEVDARLRARGFTDEVVVGTMAFLVARRYVDDEALALRRAEELLLQRGYGALRVRHELTRRGVADTVIERAIAAVLEDRRSIDLARRALARRFRDRPLVTAVDRARAYRFLVGRGHPEDVVTEVLAEEA